MPEIILRNVTKKFPNGFVAVENLNMTIENRAFVTLLGPSGCGKTTTLRMIAGLETPTTGTITINGKVVFSADEGINVSPDKRDIGFLFQNYALWPHMTVYKNIAFGLENLKWSKADIEKRVAELLKMLQIEQFAERYPAELSGGQQQRVAIARTLAPRPQVLFMDEPLSNLDAKLRGEMRTELKRLHIDTDSTFIYVTHDQLEAMTLSSKVCLMRKGVLQQYAPPLEIYNRPSNVFVADFMGNPAINLLHLTVKEQQDKEAVLDFAGNALKFMSAEALPELDEEIIVAIRPEHVAITEDSKLKAVVYATLPTGMETTVKLKVQDQLVSSVVFGSVDFNADEMVNLDFRKDKILIFDKVSEKFLASGRLSVI